MYPGFSTYLLIISDADACPCVDPPPCNISLPFYGEVISRSYVDFRAVFFPCKVSLLMVSVLRSLPAPFLFFVAVRLFPPPHSIVLVPLVFCVNSVVRAFHPHSFLASVLLLSLPPPRVPAPVSCPTMQPRMSMSPVHLPSAPEAEEVPWVGFISTPDEDSDHRVVLDNSAFWVTSEMDDELQDLADDEDIVFCLEGGEIVSAAKPKSLTMYKRVDRKIKPVPAVFPEAARVQRRFPENPLDSLSELPVHPPKFEENGRLTKERLEEMKLNTDGFLWPEEEKLFSHILQTHQNTFVFEDHQRGSFREDYFSPYVIPVVPHVPWAFTNIPIPPGIKEKVVELLKEKMSAGVYEPSQSSYRSRWFCVLKKNGKLRIVHDLQPLNRVTIRDAGLPPNLDGFVEPFAGRQCYTVFDLYWGFDARKVDVHSRDLTAFLTPLGLLRITSLPTGFTNSPAEFQACMSFILQDEIPTTADIFIDDLPIKGPVSQYLDADGNPETLPENNGIRRFIWEHAQDVHRIMHRVGHAGGTFAPGKVQMARPEVMIVGQKCTPAGRLPDVQKIDKILQWPTLRTVKDVRGFLGLCGTVRIWIQNYSAKARPLTELIRQDTEFEWNDQREEAFQTLKQAITTAPALRPIDYQSEKPVVLAVDSSYIAAGFILYQYDEDNRKRPARYGSIPMNEREARYSQPKLELYGLFRALRAYRLYLIGVKNLQVEVDAKYIKGMLNDPDLQPNATINRWIQGILLFDFDLIHVPADRHRGPDALSRREPNADDREEEGDDWLDDVALLVRLPSNKSPVASLAAVSVEGSDNSLETEHDQLETLSKQDRTMIEIYLFLTELTPPTGAGGQDLQRFVAKSNRFFVQGKAMFKRNGNGLPLKCVFSPTKRREVLQGAHEEMGHRGEQATMQTLRTRFYWPSLWNDVRAHVRSCHECQIRSTRKVEIPLTVSAPSTIFTKIYVDMMYMPLAKGFKYLIAARDDLSRAAEGRALRKATASAVAKFLWEEVFCRYGAVGQITTDNGPEVQGAVIRLMDRWGIPHVKISPYNSKANGVVERGHFVIREAIIKACRGSPNKWPDHVHHAFFADKVTVRRSTNFSPFYLLHGVDPVLPFDLSEASFMVDGYRSGMTTAELLAIRIRHLEKRPEDLAAAADTLRKARLKSKDQFEKRFSSRLTLTRHEPGSLVLVRNKEIEYSLDRKHKPRYLGPFEVERQTRGGSYVLKELDGTIWRQGVAAFRLVPYISRGDSRLQLLTNEEISDEEEAGSGEDMDLE